MGEMLPQHKIFLERIKKVTPMLDLSFNINLKDIALRCQSYLNSWDINVCDKYLNKDQNKLKKPQGLNDQSTDDWVYINNIKKIIDDFNEDVSKDNYKLQDICDMLNAMAVMIKPSKSIRPWCNAPETRIWKFKEGLYILKKHKELLEWARRKLGSMSDFLYHASKYTKHARAMYQQNNDKADTEDSTKFSKEKLIFSGLVSKLTTLQLNEENFFSKNIKPRLNKVNYTDYDFRRVVYEVEKAIGKDVFEVMNNEVIRYTDSWIHLCEEFIKQVKSGKKYIEDLKNEASHFNKYAKCGDYYGRLTGYSICCRNFSARLNSIKNVVWAFNSKSDIDKHIASLKNFEYALMRII